MTRTSPLYGRCPSPARFRGLLWLLAGLPEASVHLVAAGYAARVMMGMRGLARLNRSMWMEDTYFCFALAQPSEVVTVCDGGEDDVRYDLSSQPASVPSNGRTNQRLARTRGALLSVTLPRWDFARRSRYDQSQVRYSDESCPLNPS